MDVDAGAGSCDGIEEGLRRLQRAGRADPAGLARYIAALDGELRRRVRLAAAPAARSLRVPAPDRRRAP